MIGDERVSVVAPKKAGFLKIRLKNNGGVRVPLPVAQEHVNYRQCEAGDETDSIYDEINCQEKTLTGILMLLQKCSSTPKPVGFEDRVLTESDSFSFRIE